MQFKGDDMKHWIDAKSIASKHNMFIIQKPDCFLIYRRLPHQDRGTKLGRATTTPALLALIQRFAKTTKEPHS